MANWYAAPTYLDWERNENLPRWPAADLSVLHLLASVGRRLAASRRNHAVGRAREKKGELLGRPAASEVNENERAKRAGMSSAGGKGGGRKRMWGRLGMGESKSA